MTRQPFALRSVLNPIAIQEILGEQYDIGPWKECKYWLRGLNDTYRIRSSQGYYILRVYRREVHEQDVKYELALLSQLQSLLADKCTSVAEAVADKNGRNYTVLDAPEGPRCAVLFRYVDGEENGMRDEESCFAFGRSAAELHQALDRVELNLPRYALDTRFLVDEPLERIVGHVGAEHESVPFLRQFAYALKEKIEQASEQGLDWGLCHGDMHGNNNVHRDGERFAHIDFEWAAPGWRAYDLAQVLLSRKRHMPDQAEKLWAAVMEGYRSVRGFSAQDEEAVRLFAAARRWWVMSLDAAFVPTDTGALDFGEDWLQGFIAEFREMGIVPA